jgi:4-hydroxybutyrate dehydrogenase
MKQFRIKTTIQEYDYMKDFCKDYQIGETDLVFISGHTYEKYKDDFSQSAIYIDLRKYGAGEPSDEMVEAIYQDIKEYTYHRVFALGGGSILDVAKLFALRHRSPVNELFDKKLVIKKEKELILVPTTCGTGSEVTNISILDLISRNTKLGLAVDELYADTAVLITELLETLPYKSFATSSIDALIHAMESYLSPKANSFTELYSREAMELILRGYQRIVEDGEAARFPLLRKFLIASTYAGIAFGNAGCAAVHALSYPLGSVLHIPHGEANYTVFTEVLKCYLRIKPEGKIRELNRFLAEILDCNIRSVYTELDYLLQGILPKKNLHQYGLPKANLEDFTDSVMTKQGRLMANNYVSLSRDAVYEIYRAVY